MENTEVKVMEFNDVEVIKRLYDIVAEHTDEKVNVLWVTYHHVEYKYDEKREGFIRARASGGSKLGDNWQHVAEVLYMLHNEFPTAIIDLEFNVKNSVKRVTVDIKDIFK